MKTNRSLLIRKTILAVIFIVIIVSCYFYIDYRIIKVNGQNAKELENRIMPVIKTNDVIDLCDITPFNWEKIYYFHAYALPKQMYEKTGARWTNCNTFMKV